MAYCLNLMNAPQDLTIKTVKRPMTEVRVFNGKTTNAILLKGYVSVNWPFKCYTHRRELLSALAKEACFGDGQ